ncbi:hypothetical protein BKA60DRAFT_617795 [Fusarium oxysporum]|nr:hypothetical protein BKA60DRAFT_617795 [Fusarium oxysporum]
MWILLPLMSFLSLAGANFLRHNMPGWSPSYNSSTYYWGCGTNTTAARSDCEHALNIAIHSPRLVKIQKNQSMWSWFRSCKVTVATQENFDPKWLGSAVITFEITDAWVFGHERSCFGTVLVVRRLIGHFGYTHG